MTSEQNLEGSRTYSSARIKRRQQSNKINFPVKEADSVAPPLLKRRSSILRDPNENKRRLSGDNRVGFFFKQGVHSTSGSSPESGSGDSLKHSRTAADLLDPSAATDERQKIKILGSLLPDEVLSNPVSLESRVYQAAVLFPDVSGFTQLCQKYDKTGKGGPSRLTAVLNGYIGSMIKIVLSRDGDVLKFGGDAFLCTWKVTSEIDLSESVHRAIESAIDIQKRCGEHKTDVGVKLRVKVAVSAGTAVFSNIGSRNRRHYVIVGTPVLDVREAEQLCRPGDVIVSPSAWRHVKNYMFYSFTYHSDERHIRVHDFGPLFRRNSGDAQSKKKGPQPGGTRPFLKGSFPLKISELRPFILPPVMRSIDLNRSLDYLTEMRQVAIVFFNIIADFEKITANDLVNLCNRIFQMVSSTVDKAGGGTNKLTLFDKDMAILTVFGLKGFKHALASQVALKCAYSCLDQLKDMDIVSASAGVTTGMAYCGVIGHALRKEYTVMGHPVNMAARLMCAYQNMVSCDRNTFLNSKLESGHFEVLHLEFMKGIQSAGPFYKFNINPKRLKVKVGRETQPLLGREKEVKKFEDFLKEGMQRKSDMNFFIIFGAARIGKSRLVQRLVNLTQEYLSYLHSVRGEVISNFIRLLEVREGSREILVIPLTEDDSMVSLSTMRLIFQPLLGLGDSSSLEERQDKILNKLEDFKELQLLAVFNQIFNVNFELTPEFLSLGLKELNKIQMGCLQRLYQKCFPRTGKWVIVIEDAEFMDEMSWKFLLWCSLYSRKALYLMTIGEKKSLPEVALDCLDKMRATTITLKEIDKWFYLGLACQILGVQAIPVELENMIQSYKSSGNPGWLESFLLSLVQSKSIYVTQVSSRQLKNMELVAPQEFMLSKSANKQRESIWVDCLETFETNKERQQNVRVCLLNPEFRLGNEGEAELMMDSMFLKTIDTLEPLEQLVLKVGSVLGNNLIRNALEFIISKETPVEAREFAKAIQNLFQRKILKCGKGDLTQKNLFVPKRMITDSSRNKEVTCECVGLTIPKSCADLPKYANCGYMQFGFASFRETLYNLLLDGQKKSFHNSSIEYFRENTYRCKACNNIRFQNVLGVTKDNELVLVCTKTSMHGVRSTKLDPKSNTPVRLRMFSVRHVDRASRDGSEINVTGAADVGDCQCGDILSLVYSVMLEHAVGAGRKDVMLEIKLELAAVSLTMYNIPLTMQILQNALNLVEKIKEEKEYPEFCSPFIYSKIYTLMGATKLSMGRLDESLELLKKCLQYMNLSFPTSKFQVKFFTIKQVINLKMSVSSIPGKRVGKVSEKKAPYTDLLSECLGLISVAHMYSKNLTYAKYASLWSLNKALESNTNLYALCTAYTNVIEMFLFIRDLQSCAKLEVYAVELCKKCSLLKIELYEWEAIGRLYKVIFQTRHVRAEIEEAVQIGFQSIRIASQIRSTNLKMDLIPDLIFTLILMHRLSEAVNLLQELEFVSRLDSDKSTRLWYYAISLEFQLYTGFTVVTYDACEDFAKTADSALTRDLNAKYRLLTCMWLWCVRNGEWELVKSHWRNIKNAKGLEEDTAAAVFSRLERLEGLLVILVSRLDARNIHSVTQLFSEIHALMHRLEKDIKVVKVFEPRFHLLKTYYRQIRYKDNSYPRLLNKVQMQAEKMKDKNTYQWVMHLKMLWSNAISQFQREHWTEHCRQNVIEWHESDREAKRPIIAYSLPLPKL